MGSVLWFWLKANAIVRISVGLRKLSDALSSLSYRKRLRKQSTKFFFFFFCSSVLKEYVVVTRKATF